MGVLRGLIVLLMITVCLGNSQPHFPVLKCGYGKVFTECGANCFKTCEKARTPKFLHICTLDCTSGCICQKGLVQDSDGTCVKEEQCGCLVPAPVGGKNEYHQQGVRFSVALDGGRFAQCSCNLSGEFVCSI